MRLGKSSDNTHSEAVRDRLASENGETDVGVQVNQLQRNSADSPLLGARAQVHTLKALSGARPAPFPSAFKPQLAMLYKSAPSGDDWLHEIKYDGYRLLAVKQDQVRLVTRNGKDWTSKFPSIVKALAQLPESIVDGELVYVDEQGVSNFEGLQTVMKTGKAGALAFYAFDLPYCQGYDLTAVSLIQRKQQLARVIAELDHSQIRFSNHIEGAGNEVIEHACQHGLEGIISKQRDSGYASKRAKTWRKVKCSKRQEFVILGYTAPNGSREGFGALLLGYYQRPREGGPADQRNPMLKYAGKVGTGFRHEQLRSLRERLDKLSRKRSPLAEDAGEKDVTWVKPELVAEVEFTEWTAGDRLRHPAFVDLRADKPAADIVREVPEDQKSSSPETSQGNQAEGARSTSNANQTKKSTSQTDKASKSKSSGESSRVAGVDLSSPDKVLYVNAGFTKQDLADYYEQVGERMLPYISNRPLTLVRCPRGHTRHCFFQKHLGDTFSAAVKPVFIPEKRTEKKAEKKAEKMGPADHEDSQYAYIDSVAGLVELVQMGTLEIHAWGSCVDDIEKPDQVVFDLDPDPGIAWQDIKRAAVELKDYLQELGLQSFLRTSGGKGLHLVVPLQRRHSWEQVKAFAKAVAQSMAAQQPERYTANMSKAKRKSKIFIDYLRNTRGATSICNYSTRSRDYAPVAVPLAWDELEDLQRPDAFRLDNLVQHLNESDDPWHNYHQLRQSITQAMRRRLKLE